MTLDQFRSLPEHTARIRELLADPIVATLIVALKENAEPQDVPLGAPDNASVRSLSYLAGYNQAVKDLLKAATNFVEEDPEEEPTWGTTVSDTKPTT